MLRHPRRVAARTVEDEQEGESTARLTGGRKMEEVGPRDTSYMNRLPPVRFRLGREQGRGE